MLKMIIIALYWFWC